MPFTATVNCFNNVLPPPLVHKAHDPQGQILDPPLMIYNYLPYTIILLWEEGFLNQEAGLLWNPLFKR